MSTDTQNTQQMDELQSRYLTFYIDNEVYGIDIRFVTEIIGVLPITRVPEVPGYIKGIINLRGKIIPVIDMRLRFNKEPIEYNDRTCIIIIETQEMVAGLIVDKVAEVLTIAETDIAPPPSHKAGVRNHYICGIGKIDGEIKLLLDCEKLLEEDTAEAAVNVNAQ